MADDQLPPPKKVVKRVVKKSVATPKEAAPQVRYGRPVATAPRPQAKSEPAPSKRTPKTPRPKKTVASKVKGAQKSVTSKSTSAASGVVGAFRSGATRTGEAVSDWFYRVRTWRMPHWSPLPASVFTGAVVGIIAVGLGLASKSLFNELRGVSAGGGRWGSLTFVVVAFVAFVLGELLLSGFGVAQARLTSFLGVVLTIVAMLGLFLGLADTAWALLIVPAVAVISYVVAKWLLDIADSTDAETD